MMALRHLPQRGDRDVGELGDVGPLSLVSREASLQEFDTACVFHAAHYPHSDSKINPHSDFGIRQNFRMDFRALRDILANNVKARRIERGWTQPELAARAGIGQSHVSRIENARNGVTIDRLSMVASALGCPAWQLLTRSDAERREAVERMLAPQIPPHLPEIQTRPEKRVAHKRKSTKKVGV